MFELIIILILLSIAYTIGQIHKDGKARGSIEQKRNRERAACERSKMSALQKGYVLNDHSSCLDESSLLSERFYYKRKNGELNFNISVSYAENELDRGWINIHFTAQMADINSRDVRTICRDGVERKTYTILTFPGDDQRGRLTYADKLSVSDIDMCEKMAQVAWQRLLDTGAHGELWLI